MFSSIFLFQVETLRQQLQSSEREATEAQSEYERQIEVQFTSTLYMNWLTVGGHN